MSEIKVNPRQVDGLEAELDGKQDTLVSGTNIKTVNSQSLLGPGDIVIEGGEGSGETNTASSVGIGTPIFQDKVGVDLRFKTIAPGGGIGFSTSLDNAITITNTAQGEANTASNLGTGTGLFDSKSVANLRFKSIAAGTNVTLADSAGTVTINATAGAGGEVNTASNIGGGTPVYDSKVGADLRFRSLVAGTGVSISSAGGGATTITNTSPGETNTAINIGAGTGVYAAKSGSQLQFKSLKAGTNISLSSTGDEVTVNATAGGGDAYLANTQTFTGVNTFNALTKMGTTTTDTNPWGGAGGGAGAIYHEVGIGTNASPSTNNKAGLYIEKWCSNNAGATIGDVGAAHFKVRKKSGASNLSGATITAIQDTGSGDLIGLHSRAITLKPLSGSPAGSVYGGWFFAQNSGGAGSGHLAGIEINVAEQAVDAGHREELSGNLSTGLWLALHESVRNCTAAIATAPIGPGASKWHTGLLIATDTIVPYDGFERNEAILVQGGSADAQKYTALRATGYLRVGIDFRAVTNQIHALIVKNESFISFTKGNGTVVKMLTVASDNISRIHTAGTNTAEGFAVSRQSDDSFRAFFDNSDTNPVSLFVNGALKQVSQGAANSGGTGFAVLRVVN